MERFLRGMLLTEKKQATADTKTAGTNIFFTEFRQSHGMALICYAVLIFHRDYRHCFQRSNH